MATKPRMPEKFDFEEDLDKAIGRARQTVEDARSSIETKTYPQRRAVVIADDEAYLHEASRALMAASVDALVFHPSDIGGIDSAVSVGGTTVFASALTSEVCAILLKARPRKVIVACSEEEQIAHHKDLVDMGAVVVRTRVSPDLLKLAV